MGRNVSGEGYQEISLQNECVRKGIVLHELMHTLGFYHEQGRYDRDKFVEIFWENIIDGKQLIYSAGVVSKNESCRNVYHHIMKIRTQSKLYKQNYSQMILVI